MSRTQLVAAVACALALPTFASAQTEPPPCSAKGSPHVRCAVVDTDSVIVLRVHRGASLLLEVPEDETIRYSSASDNKIMAYQPPSRRIASADGSMPGEEGTTDGNLAVSRPRGNFITIKPEADLLPQPFFLLAQNGDGPMQRYRFQIQPAERDQAFYSVRLRNVAAENARRRSEWQKNQNRRNSQVLQEKLAQAKAAPCAANPDVNVRWIGMGDASLAPSEICDDGAQVHMRFPGSMRATAVFTQMPNGENALVNQRANADGWLTIHDNSPRITLTFGDITLCLINKGYSPVGRTTGTRTISPGVVLAPKEPTS